MKKKHLVILGVLLAVLAAGVLIRQFQKPAELTREEYILLLPSFDASEVAKIHIAKGEENAVALEKSEAGWVIPALWKARADNDKIDKFLGSLQRARGELRATGEAFFSDFGIEQNQAVAVSLFDSGGTIVQKILLGTKEAGYGFNFIRKDGSEEIYLADADFFGEMGLYGGLENAKPSHDAWAEMRFIRLDPGKVQSVEARRVEEGEEKVSLSLVRIPDANDPEKKNWKFSRPESTGEIDTRKVEQYLNLLSNAYASKTLDPKAKDYGFEKPAWQMTLGLEGEKKIVIKGMPLDKNSGDYVFEVSGEPALYQISSYYFEDLNSEDAKFLRTEKPEAQSPKNPA